jgi:hypothetical protein
MCRAVRRKPLISGPIIRRSYQALESRLSAKSAELKANA